MTRERLRWMLGWLLAALALALGGWWLSLNTEWVEVDSARPLRGAARDNPVYAFEQLLRRLDMTVERHEALDAMPPERARLLLLSNDWELLPGRAEALQQWVQRGGHLVLLQGTDWDDTDLERWVPVSAVKLKPPPRPASAASASAPRSKSWESIALTSSPPLWDGNEALAACELFPMNRKLQAKPGQKTQWTVKGDDKAQVLRVPIGEGTVTVLNTGREAFHNGPALRCDNPLLLAATVQAQPGATAWIYLNEKRKALLPWLWQQGWIAIVAGALALAAALWRGAVRFGPRLAEPPRLRRSISEQVRGLGSWLDREGPEGRAALLTAQQRALDEAAARQLPAYARLAAPERVRAIAAATALPADALSTAFSAGICTRVQLPQYLQVLEAARRRLLKINDER